MTWAMRDNYAHTAKWHATTDGHHTLCRPNEADPFNPWTWPRGVTRLVTLSTRLPT
jgi:hypothetical protein